MTNTWCLKWIFGHKVYYCAYFHTFLQIEKSENFPHILYFDFQQSGLTCLLCFFYITVKSCQVTDHLGTCASIFCTLR